MTCLIIVLKLSFFADFAWSHCLLALILEAISLNEESAIKLRPLHHLDDVPLAKVIRAALVEFGAARPGFAWQDPELDVMNTTYNRVGCLYLVAVDGENVLGGAGIGPLSGVDATCELQKMYLAPSARGQGVGRRLMGRLLEEARLMGYRRIYLETLTGMVEAQQLYRAWGFNKIAHPLGQTGHAGCDCWFLKELHGANL